MYTIHLHTCIHPSQTRNCLPALSALQRPARTPLPRLTIQPQNAQRAALQPALALALLTKHHKPQLPAPLHNLAPAIQCLAGKPWGLALGGCALILKCLAIRFSASASVSVSMSVCIHMSPEASPVSPLVCLIQKRFSSTTTFSPFLPSSPSPHHLSPARPLPPNTSIRSFSLQLAHASAAYAITCPRNESFALLLRALCACLHLPSSFGCAATCCQDSERADVYQEQDLRPDEMFTRSNTLDVEILDVGHDVCIASQKSKGHHQEYQQHLCLRMVRKHVLLARRGN
jgi:hypothetical protein